MFLTTSSDHRRPRHSYSGEDFDFPDSLTLKSVFLGVPRYRTSVPWGRRTSPKYFSFDPLILGTEVEGERKGR